MSLQCGPITRITHATIGPLLQIAHAGLSGARAPCEADGKVMASYRVYGADGAGRLTRADWIEAQSDDEAMKKAAVIEANGAFELWHKTRLVGRSVKPIA